MPVVGIPLAMLLSRLGRELERDALVEQLQRLGCDVEGFVTLTRFRCERCDNILEITETEHPPVLCDRCAADFRTHPAWLIASGASEVIRMEALAVRPDMFDPGGLARVLRHYLGWSDRPCRYAVAPAQLSVQVAAELSAPQSFRPSIACAVVRDITLDDDAIKVLMKLQENLHWALGRDRKRASIGVYDLDTLQGRAFAYRTVGPDELRFVPLGGDLAAADGAMTPREILERHPKGKAYARLLGGFERYPLLCDESGQVLSMPPIINSEQTRVTPRTRHFFIDVTGQEDRIVNKALNVLCASLAELDPRAQLEQVDLWHEDRRHATPDLTAQVVSLEVEEAARTIGVALSPAQAAECLRRMGHGVAESGASGRLVVEVPAYRNDIMHPIDLVEDLAIAYGYHNIQPELVPTFTVGQELFAERRANAVRAAMTGLGYLEVITLLLSSEAQHYAALRLEPRQDRVRIENPISAEQTMVRTSLLPGLLDTLSANTDHEMPQRIFEVGQVSYADPREETGATERLVVAGATTGPRSDFAEALGACDALLRELGWRIETGPLALGCFIPGRGARITVQAADGPRCIGMLGEIHPEVLEQLKLVQPVAAFEVDLQALGTTGR